MIKWLHHLFNPHCIECKTELEEKLERIEHNSECKSCDTLRAQLDIANYEKKELLNRLLSPIMETRIEGPDITPESLKAKAIPWRMRQQMLEAEDRVRAQAIRNAPKPVEDLEKELGVVEEEKVNGKG